MVTEYERKRNVEYYNLHKVKLLQQSKTYYDENVERILKQHVKYYLSNTSKIKSRIKDWYNKNNKKILTKNRNIRILLILLLGGKCICKFKGCIHKGQCKIKDIRVLQLEHKDGKGSLDRKRFNSVLGMYSYYLNHLTEAKRKLQIMCANCNWVKRYKNNEHPYQGE